MTIESLMPASHRAVPGVTEPESSQQQEVESVAGVVPARKVSAEQQRQLDAYRLEESAKEVEPDRQSLDQVVGDINQQVQSFNRKLQFSIDDDAGMILIKVIDPETDEVIRQIPAKELVELHKHMEEMGSVIFNGSA